MLRREIGLKIVEVESDKANVEGGDVLWTGRFFIIYIMKNVISDRYSIY